MGAYKVRNAPEREPPGEVHPLRGELSIPQGSLRAQTIHYSFVTTHGGAVVLFDAHCWRSAGKRGRANTPCMHFVHTLSVSPHIFLTVIISCNLFLEMTRVLYGDLPGPHLVLPFSAHPPKRTICGFMSPYRHLVTLVLVFKISTTHRIRKSPLTAPASPVVRRPHPPSLLSPHFRPPLRHFQPPFQSPSTTFFTFTRSYSPVSTLNPRPLHAKE